GTRGAGLPAPSPRSPSQAAAERTPSPACGQARQQQAQSKGKAGSLPSAPPLAPPHPTHWARPHPSPRLLSPANGGGGAARLPWRRAAFVLGGVPGRRHGWPTAVPAEVGPVLLAVAARASAAGEGGGALQKRQLSDREERSRGNREETAAPPAGSSRFPVSRLLVAGVDVRRRGVPGGRAQSRRIRAYRGQRAGPGGRSTSRRATFNGGSERKKPSETGWEKKELKNEVWEYSSYVMCFVNDQLLGDALDLQKWAHKIWDIIDFRPPALYEALTVDFSTNFLRDTKHDFVFLDIAIDFYPIGRLIFELYCDVCPKTCKNFQVLCTGIAGFSQSGFRLHYAGSIFHRIVRNGWIQGGDIVAGKGDGGESIYGPTFEDENFTIPHNKRGVLGMVNKGRHSNGSQFYITLQPTPYLDRKYVAFGQLIEGTEVLQQLELVPTENERPTQQCIIIDSGDLYT
uniref:Probable inactive peptidyl-prolyl cis-trans isomerase-like 6 n=1 Tax=Equus asinus asinus TaxID=83772 RepID=A0A8C4LJU2_EQUAS